MMLYQRRGRGEMHRPGIRTIVGSGNSAPSSLCAPFPFDSVIPPPPRGLLERFLRRLTSTISWVVSFLLVVCSIPFLLLIHALLVYCDGYNREVVARHRRKWLHQTVPHVRPVRVAPSPNFPLEGWHMRCEDGRQRWHYGRLLNVEEGNELGKAQAEGCPYTPYGEAGNANDDFEDTGATRTGPRGGPDMRAVKEERCRFVERYQLGLTGTAHVKPRGSVEEAMRAGAEFLLRLQHPYSGHWPNDYSGPLFLTPGVIFVRYIVARGNIRNMFPPHADHQHEGDEPCLCGEAERLELIRYIRNYMNEDGGFGQHTEGHSTMLGTVLNYVALRLMGVSDDDSDAARARQWIRGEGGAVSIPTWGKVWLCVLGLYDWDGVNPIPPELSLLPNWIPFSPSRLWCHSRVVSIAFSYLYGLRWRQPDNLLLQCLRYEIYLEPYGNIKWAKHRSNICAKDCYTPLSSVYKVFAAVMSLYEKRPIKFLRRRALEVAWTHIAYDDESTHFICLGPVNKAFDMLITWIREGETSGRYLNHLNRLDDYFFMGPEGLRMSGYNGSQLWDTSFAVQALCACNMELLYPEEMALAHHYVDVAQVQENPVAATQFYRHRTKGAWNFSTRPQAWQVSDCTAEGLRVLLLLRHKPFPHQRIYDAVDQILSLRNRGGGWASYEPTCAPHYVELLNCSDVFKDVMTDYVYTECTSSCVHTLSLFREHFPDYRREDVDRAIRDGVKCMLANQRTDGSYYGSWAVCFTYAAWLCASALRISGEIYGMEGDPTCVRLVNFLLSHQNTDGGWGEDVSACARGVWVDNPSGSQVVNTAWAVMAIMAASGEASSTELRRQLRILKAVSAGIHFIVSRQLSTGDWAQERISGVFNGNNPIHYPGYKNTMPVWALGVYRRWSKTYGQHFPRSMD
ncbi:lanosterol synthase [Trypanosoma brucei brucei TREU927]|uniref:Lanosterol synthase n=1 Tax=Trypanosoma brucei brucei (strain 927/4 GUTat10.1) TaxID=185431 RepID=Q57ZG6_TRYB2|nr:lanosterol synthase [Trypanosoma brucei brucei TREU927]AAX79515.1 lanosterol synthase [Trypanosoma brucei]AAZ12587.1 lanosterol synthase [Trypanosoma brucei brucei TREU927]